MSKFIKEIEKNNLLTLFIKEIFDYKSLEDYNYIFRMIEEKNAIIIDIYDNVDGNHFNRYIFNFSKKDFEYKSIEKNNIVINYINIYNITNQKNNLLKYIQGNIQTIITTTDLDQVDPSIVDESKLIKISHGNVESVEEVKKHGRK